MEQEFKQHEKNQDNFEKIVIKHIEDEEISIERVGNILSNHIEGMESRRIQLEGNIKNIIDSKMDSIHKMLEKQNEKSDIFHKKVDAHIAIVEPYITGAESAIRVGSFVGKTLMALGAFVLTVGGAWILIKNKFLGL